MSLTSFFYCFFYSVFCVATDVQAFTSELKNKSSAKCRGKVETDFTRERFDAAIPCKVLGLFCSKHSAAIRSSCCNAKLQQVVPN